MSWLSTAQMMASPLCPSQAVFAHPAVHDVTGSSTERFSVFGLRSSWSARACQSIGPANEGMAVSSARGNKNQPTTCLVLPTGSPDIRKSIAYSEMVWPLLQQEV